jgi:DNA uptake protein ComE-like DNA-binding protein
LSDDPSHDAAGHPVAAVDLLADSPPEAPPRAKPQPASNSVGRSHPGFFRRLGTAARWTAPQRRAMAAVLGVVLAVLVWRTVRDRAYISEPQPSRPAKFGELADRLDPNTASWEELVAIPTLGEKRARAVVEYRENWLKRHPGEGPAFKSALDLVVVRGIGASMVETLSGHLVFPAARPATPATSDSMATGSTKPVRQ